MFGKIIFNLFAFTLFILMFFKMIRKNDTTYIYILIVQFIGILINFLELIFGVNLNAVIKVIIYVLSIFIPIFILILEYKNKMYFPEFFYLLVAKISVFFKNDSKARKCLETLIKKYPESTKGAKSLAQLFEKHKKYLLAIEQYEKIYEIDEKNEKIALKLGKLYNKTGRVEESKTVLYNLLKQNPNNYDVSITLGEILYNNSQYKEAAQVYMQALRYNQTDYELYYNLGMTFTMLNDFQKAKSAYEKAAQINTYLYHSQYSLGQISLIYGELEEAKKYFMQCLENEELEAGAYYYLARIALIKGEKDSAINYVNIAIEENAQIYKRIEEDNIFVPIKDLINKPTKNKQENLGKRLSAKENKIENYLYKTCNLVGKLNNNDIEMMENLKKLSTKEKKIENEIENDKY